MRTRRGPMRFPSARLYFKCALGKGENAEYPAPGGGLMWTAPCMRGPGDGDAHAVQIGDHGEQRHPGMLAVVHPETESEKTAR